MVDNNYEAMIERERRHIGHIIEAVRSFRSLFGARGFAHRAVMARLEALDGFLSNYNGILFENGRPLDTKFRRETHRTLSQSLVLIKAQLFFDLSMPDQDVARPLENPDCFFDLLSHAKASGKDISADYDDLFAQLDILIQIQNDYTAVLLADNLKEQFFDLLGAPGLEVLLEQVDYVRSVLESNQAKLEAAENALKKLHQDRAQTAAMLIQTQRGIDETRRALGLEPVFGLFPKVVDNAKSPANMALVANDV